MLIYIDNISLYTTAQTLSMPARRFLLQEDGQLPPLVWVPAMQRRRLSSFAKMALQVAYCATLQGTSPCPVVFASRHGDLHRTSKIITDMVTEHEISPTSFGLSVHNAVVGLWSILTCNRNEMNAISAGKDSFLAALIETCAYLKTYSVDSLLVIYADQVLPAPYDIYQDEQQADVALGFRVSLSPFSDSSLEENTSIAIELSPSTHQAPSTDSLQALQFIDWLAGEQQVLPIGQSMQWECRRV
ncbi:beta-ketoacyl synthase chain length factor [Pseudoalteromonas ulvae]|uniref:Beta-ketoacyl synthase-like N-terminal domain-containing protein n=1 Tax=Pseudoalteromonas ulvae TaxID=107327 RepID=A0A244CLI6_PSEDV|nr:beta-ketoacyl synthase chain length factor [Pseudoalteromonas ulvae]OUL56462.1 hypothetical protein B1199_17520 [Pseudoalteromonas ulvae]